MDSYIKDGKVYFNNGTECGNLVWSNVWKYYHFVPKSGCQFSNEWLIDIACLMRKMGKSRSE